EQVLNWSGLPVVQVRSTVFLQHPFFLEMAAESIRREGTIQLPFGSGRTSPIDTLDVAEVIAAILASPAEHVGKVYELTGPKSQAIRGVGAESPGARGGPVASVDVPLEQGRDKGLRPRGLPEHVYEHWLTMAKRPAATRSDRLTHDLEAILGRPATSARDFVS